MTDHAQLALFAESRRLVDVPLAERTRAAEQLLPAADLDERWTILALVVCPAAFAEAQW